MEILLCNTQGLPKYIHIKNFLSDSVLEAWQARSLSESYEPGLVSTPTSPDDLKPQIKRNQNHWYRGPDDLCREFHKAYWGSTVQSAVGAMNDLLFDAQRMITEGNFLLSEYVEGDHYDWHQDLTPYTSATWIVAQAERGGGFEISADPIKPNTHPRQVQASVQQRHWVDLAVNDLLIFPSHYYHRVTPVIQGRRVSLQYFTNRTYS